MLWPLGKGKAKTNFRQKNSRDLRRNLAKINYRIHTDAIKEKLIPPELSKPQIDNIYASEADVLNLALFGKTAKEWREENPGKKGNIRDYADALKCALLGY